MSEPAPEPDRRAEEAPGPPTTGAVPRPRLLRRSRDDQVVAGVAAGLGRYVGVDPVVFRVAFAVLTFVGGSGILLYLLLAIVMPEERPGEAVEAPDRRGDLLRAILGWGLVIAGAVLLVGRFVPGLQEVVWPVALIALGAAVLVQGSRR